ncbi:siroheme decarboxylase subunit alpha [Aliarcobacter cryaerophilus]|uniref:siroheme decarboxylase subunit alpha n=1 Tax=Aliarcobacter cryaerophilus TaxID=28198 RepID=UPI0021B69E38|nr:Lrp/AsnC family transcriptional regulator [Aliarcobacter cryaerophilus]MCT7541219.1 Lrp/AsnC family transcriptional regulator [Aliarcobacter cryaerophilus]
MTQIPQLELKNEVLLRIQKNFPLVKKPFLNIANELHTTEKRVLEILNEAKRDGIIRQTSAIFDTKKLGYKSSLVAFEIEEKDIPNAVKILNSHPGISHNYERNHSFNIWFTIAIAPNSNLGLEKSIEILAKKTNAKNYIILPTLKLFKISVKLDTTNKEEKQEKLIQKSFTNLDLSESHYKFIKLLQQDIEFKSEPFKFIVDELNISYDELFTTVQEFINSGVMRRFASILNHRKAGFSANAMVVWDIDEKKSQDIGEIAASFSAVSHCYLRPQYPNWKYNLFTMIHGKTEDDTQKIIEDIANKIEYRDKMALYSSKEFKKVRIIYFSDEFENWEKENNN